MKASMLRRVINLWPPYLFSGVRAIHIASDYRAVEVQLKLHWFNRNYVGTHFGGSLFAMTDPWYMLMLLHCLGRDYLVWDKTASIDFMSPGRGAVKARFSLSEAQLALIREKTAGGDKYLPEFTVDVIGPDQETVARVTKTLYVRRKKHA